MIIKTDRIILKSPHEVNGKEVSAYYDRNRDFAREFEPVRSEAFYTEAYQNELLESLKEDWESQRGYCFFIFLSDMLIGKIALNNIVMGAFCSCFLGYGLDEMYANQGYMTEALKRVIVFAFEELKLHRIEGNIMPRNKASRAVVEKCHFTNEGVSRKYLKINGVWEDHIHYVLLNDSFES